MAERFISKKYVFTARLIGRIIFDARDCTCVPPPDINDYILLSGDKKLDPSSNLSESGTVRTVRTRDMNGLKYQ